MNVLPISQGPRITRAEAIRQLKEQGFTFEEALQFLDEPDKEKRKAMSALVAHRRKGGDK